MDEQKKDESIPSWFWWTGTAIIVLWIVALVVPYLLFRDWPKQGEFGDTFGSVNALFSGFAFLGVLLALHLQRRDLRLQSEALKAQKDELELTRAEIRGQKEEMLLQRETMQKQQFEATFFKLLDHFNVYVGEMNAGDIKHPSTGLEMFRSFRNGLLFYYNEAYKRSIQTPTPVSSLSATAWADFIHSKSALVDPYVRLLHRVLNYADNNAPRGEDMYIHIVRDSLTKDELVLLFFAGVSGSFGGLKELIERYGLLRFLNDPDLIALPGGTRDHYNPSAYT